MSYLKLIYRDQEYTLKEWNDEQKRFEQHLELLEGLVKPGLKDFSAVQDVGYSIALAKLEGLCHLIAGARYALISAHEILHDSNIINWQSGYVGQLWYRAQQLKNSIIWYDSCEDYLYQMLWFGYDMHGQVISSREIYLSELTKARYGNVIKKLKLLKGTEYETNADELLKIIDNYHLDPKTTELRDNFANNIKHRGNLNFEGLDSTRFMGFKICDKDKNVKFDIDWVDPDRIDIDKTITFLKDVHIRLLDYVRSVVGFMDFDNIFEYEGEQAILNNRKDKRLYKKINFE